MYFNMTYCVSFNCQLIACPPRSCWRCPRRPCTYLRHVSIVFHGNGSDGSIWVVFNHTLLLNALSAWALRQKTQMKKDKMQSTSSTPVLDSITIKHSVRAFMTLLVLHFNYFLCASCFCFALSLCEKGFQIFQLCMVTVGWFSWLYTM